MEYCEGCGSENIANARVEQQLTTESHEDAIFFSNVKVTIIACGDCGYVKWKAVKK